jgi:hypothetical protein
MLKSRFHFLDMLFGMLLGLAVFAMGSAFWSSQRSSAQGDSATKPDQARSNAQHEQTWWERASDPTAAFTLGLIIIGGAQLGLFYWQLRLIRDSLDDAKQAADAAAEAAAAATRQAKVAEDSLNKLERPYIFIFNLSRLDVDEMDEDADGVLLSVTYSVANYGKIPAIIKYAQAILAVGEEPPLPDRLPESRTLVAAPIFAAGEARHEIAQRYVWLGGSEFDEDGATIPSIPTGSVLFLWIIITYRGPFTDQHETRACWIYNENTGRFNGPWGTQEYSGEK